MSDTFSDGEILHVARHMGTFLIVAGVLGVIAGILALVYPDITLLALALIAGINLMVLGILALIDAFAGERDTTSRVLAGSAYAVSGLGELLVSRSARSSVIASKRIRCLRRAWSRNRLVVIRCSQPAKVPGVYVDSDRNTRTKTSWVRSSASWRLPVRR